MLETVLKIGKAFRESSTGLKHHRYVVQCPPDTEKKKVLRLALPVRDDFSFDFNGIKEITDENVIQDRLFYLKFKTSDADGLVKYIFGDIYYALSKGKESGYYRMADIMNKQKAYQVSSFLRGKEDFKSIEQTYGHQLKESGFSELEIEKKKERFSVALFRDEFEKNILFIERMLKYQCGILEYLELKRDGEAESLSFIDLLSDESKLKKLTAKHVFSTIKNSRGAKKTFKQLLDIAEPEYSIVETSETVIKTLINYSTSDLFLHFDFIGKHWYEFDYEFKLINRKLLGDFAEESINKKGYILKKFVYKTLSSPEKDLQFPTFNGQARFRNKLFGSLDEVSDLLYAIDYSRTAKIKVPYTDIKIVVLPRGDNLSAKHFENFNRIEKSLQDEQEQEAIISAANTSDSYDDLFAPLLERAAEEIMQFDLIFSKKGGLTSPDVDLIEVSGLEKSHLKEICQRIERVKQALYSKRERELKTALKPFGITWSFLNILKDATSDMKKYQSHLYKILPQIYSATYYNDAILLSALIEKTELHIRTGVPNFNLLKYDFYFLISIQNTTPEGGNLMKIQESPSYKIGLLLGELAEPFAAWRNDCPIKSFEKSYVGTLTRRIATIQDLIKFKNIINEKLTMHEKNFKNIKDTSFELDQILKAFTGRYDKNECAFGFFESYFKKYEGQSSTSQSTQN